MIDLYKLIDETLEGKLTKGNVQVLLNKLFVLLGSSPLIIYGAAGTAKFYGEFFIKNGIEIECFIDKNAKIIKELFGLPVYDSETFLKNKEKNVNQKYNILIATSCKFIDEISEQIDLLNFKVNNVIDGASCFNLLQEYVRILSAEDEDICVSSSDISPQETGFLSVPFFELAITTFCTLRCRHCAHLNAHYYFTIEGQKKLKHYSASNIILVMKKILDSVDEIRELCIDGGEPLLHPELDEVMKFLLETKKIKRIEFVTNATLLPKICVIKCLKDKKIHVTISDYGKVSKCKTELVQLLAENKVNYRVQVQGYGWDDLGEHYCRNRSSEELKNVYNNCFDTRYKLILGDRIYACHRVANASNLNYYKPTKKEYIEVFKYSQKKLRKKIRNLYFVDSIPYCNYCNGKGNLVVAALQYSSEEIKELKIKNGCNVKK